MIITQLNGGLGNQMFQYAVGRNLAVLHNTSLLLDTSLLNKGSFLKTYRTYSLGVYNINAEIADIKTMKNIARQKSIIFKPLNIFSKQKIRLIREQGFEFQMITFKPDENVCLNGYWQSEKYFKDIRDLLLMEFNPKNEISGKNKFYADLICSVNSVSMHIRRGDYISNPITNKVHGFLGIDYYKKAMELIESKINKPVYFILSDDIDWCKESIKTHHELYFIDHNNENEAHEDLRLMSLCQHNVIANSSFSWWGAWLNKNPEKIVIAPKRWFKDFTKITIDLFPEKWTLL